LPVPDMTPRQKDVLRYFERRDREGGPPPTYAEIARNFGWTSITAAKRHVTALVRMGVLSSQGRGARRGVFSVFRSANTTMLVDRLDGAEVVQLTVPTYLMPEEGVRFAFQVRDSSMAAFGILENDLVLCGPRSASASPRLLVGSVNAVPRVLHPRQSAAGRKVHGVVVGVMRSLVATATRG
jgi:SOS-response transcriptional repressor LexA